MNLKNKKAKNKRQKTKDKKQNKKKTLMLINIYNKVSIILNY